jgi:DNA-binding transcriptional regulator YiaG
MFNDPCGVCGVRRLDHDPHQIRHPYRSPILDENAQAKHPDDWEDVPAGSSDLVERAVFRHFEREADGRYDAPLPSPADRKRIRVQAGLAQQDLADRLHVSRNTVMRWDKPAGYRNGKRLPGREPGREPVSELRESYSDLLRRLLGANSIR